MSFRSPKLLRAVSEAPCMNCGIEGQTQAAHSNQLKHGKGRSLKSDDCFVAALCVTCHAQLDSGRALSREERREMWQDAFEQTHLWLWSEGKVTVK